MKEKLEACIVSIPDADVGFLTREELQQILATIQYSAVPGSARDVYTVTATGPDGEFATWSVNTSTESVTAADPVAAELDPYCPNFA